MNYEMMKKEELLDVLLDRGMGYIASLYPKSKSPTIAFIKKQYGLLKTWDKYEDSRKNHKQWVKDLNTLSKDQLIQIVYFSCEDSDISEEEADESYEEFLKEL